MDDWKFAQIDPEALARLHCFSAKKKHASGEMDVHITVQEFATPNLGALQFFAMADIELNQKAAKLQPSGWGDTLMGALSECMKNIRRFEYEGPDESSSLS